MSSEVSQTQQQQTPQANTQSIEAQLALIQAEADAIAAQLASQQTSTSTGNASNQSQTSTGGTPSQSTQTGIVHPPAQARAITLAQDAASILTNELYNFGFDEIMTAISADYFRSLVHNLPTNLIGVIDSGEFKQDLLNEFSKARNSVDLSKATGIDFGVSLIQSILIQSFTDYISTHYSPELAGALSYGLNVAADTAHGAVTGGTAGAYAAFATSVVVNTAMTTGEVVYAYIKLNQTNSDLQNAMILQGATDVNLLAAAAVNRATGNTTRANAEASIVNSSLIDYAAQVRDNLSYSNEWSIIQLLVTAKEEQLRGNGAAAAEDFAQAMDNARSLNASQFINIVNPVNYVDFANRAARAYGF